MVIQLVNASTWCAIPKACTTAIKSLGASGGEGEAISWAIVRDPFSRIYSAWCSAVASGSNWRMAEYIPMGSSFGLFVRMVAKTEDAHSELHFISQSDLMDRHHFRPDVVLRFESIREQWSAFGPRVGLSPFLPVKNQTRPDVYDFGCHAQFYDEELRQLIATRYAEDFRRFDYDLRLDYVR